MADLPGRFGGNVEELVRHYPALQVSPYVAPI